MPHHATSAPPTPPVLPVYVIGAGPGGLAVAAALGERGVRVVVLEKSGAVGASWRAHYSRLHLHTTRRWSSLPGLRMPRSFGRWVPREKVVKYLEKYAQFHGIEVVTGVEVTRVEPLPEPAVEDAGAADGPSDGARWLLRASGGRELRARALVVATGYNHTPRLPAWPGRETYTGRLLHARDYRDATPYRDMDVLVVGAGNTGAEIAVDLAEGGAARVRLAIRTPPHILRRSTLGWPAQASGILCRRLPRFLVDRAARGVALRVPGIARPQKGLATRAREGAIPVQDVGLLKAVRAGRVEPVAAVESFDGAQVRLADGTRLAPGAVVAATGYERGLTGLVGHLDVLTAEGRPRRRNPVAPGLYFTGYTTPLSGMLRELARDAPKIARSLERTAR
ncbi:flavin-containing monooxygenase [Streptomyces fuscigenes]|uniref:flavin-containing monooxygenase n=1 Tax=Streptomyces fuscigenes TaxID=1528880 RepID=UPI001F4365DA|nr:NAD(P)/FAD-dependent oxidoreductase [Streptomyces fuscigenes]MCF3965449.1 NAD(P)/FAD-dependent oxidoreductase [Streptomyces fuscigenes]